MSGSIHYLFSLQGYALEVLYTVIEEINLLLVTDKTIITRLPNILKDYKVRGLASKQFDPGLVDTIVDALIELVESNDSINDLTNKLEDYDSRFFAATLLGWFGSRSRSALPQLVDISGSSSSAVEAAKRSVILIGDASVEVLSALHTSLLEGDDGAFRELSDLAIRANYSELPVFLDILTKATGDDSPHIREAAVDTIRKLHDHIKQQFIPLLKDLVHDPNEFVKQAAIEAMDE